MTFNTLAGRALARISRFSNDPVRSIVAGLEQSITALDAAGDALEERRKRNADKSVEFARRAADARVSADRARRVANKLRDLVD